MRNDWSKGYVADVEYTGGFYAVQAPVRLNLATIIAGWEPRRIDGEFTWCELGCGQGITANLLAAAQPNGRFWAADFNPVHIANARDLAEQAGLANIEFLEKSFEELLADERLPEFDFVTLQGVYTWISPENRRAVVEFLKRRLKPGGVAFVSYNCMPGWANALPVQRLLYEGAATVADGASQRLQHGLHLVQLLAKPEISPLAQNRFVKELEEAGRTHSQRYLVHEYLNADWHPMFSIDVARELAEAKLSYVADANLFHNFPQFLLTPEQRAALDGIAAPELRQLATDICVDRRFRRDVFVRGARRLGRERQEELLRAMRMALLVPRAAVTLEFEINAGKAKLEERTYRPIFDALAEAPRTIGELLDLPAVRGSSLQAVELAGALAGSGQAQPLVADWEHVDPAPARRFNAALGRRVRHDDALRSGALAAPALGSGILVNSAELAFAGEMLSHGRDPARLARAVYEAISARGESVLKDGEPVTDRDEAIAGLGERAAFLLREIVPLWERLKAV